jgi:hypothetical protein
LALGLGTGCATGAPRAMPLGTTAVNPLSSGGVEIGMSPGIHYFSTEEDPVTTSGVLFPAVSGHLTYGLNDTMAINVRSAGTGAWGGFKIGFDQGPLKLAVMPELGLGYGTSSSETDTPAGSQEQTMSVLGVGFGVHGLLGHESGFYGSLGYNLTYLSTTQEAGGASQDTSISGHDIMLGVGYALSAGTMKIRPELDLVYRMGGTIDQEGAPQEGDTPTGPAIFVGVTVAGP